MYTPNTPHWTVRHSLNKEHSISQISDWIVIIVNYGEIPLLIITLITTGPLILHTYIICLFLALLFALTHASLLNLSIRQFSFPLCSTYMYGLALTRVR